MDLDFKDLSTWFESIMSFPSVDEETKYAYLLERGEPDDQMEHFWFLIKSFYQRHAQAPLPTIETLSQELNRLQQQKKYHLIRKKIPVALRNLGWQMLRTASEHELRILGTNLARWEKVVEPKDDAWLDGWEEIKGLIQVRLAFPKTHPAYPQIFPPLSDYLILVEYHDYRSLPECQKMILVSLMPHLLENRLIKCLTHLWKANYPLDEYVEWRTLPVHFDLERVQMKKLFPYLRKEVVEFEQDELDEAEAKLKEELD